MTNKKKLTVAKSFALSRIFSPRNQSEMEGPWVVHDAIKNAAYYRTMNTIHY
jgi:hypothetical protein